MGILDGSFAGYNLQVQVLDAGDFSMCSPDRRLLHPKPREHHLTQSKSLLPFFCGLVPPDCCVTR